MNTESAVAMGLDATAVQTAPAIDWEQAPLFRFLWSPLRPPSGERFEFLSQAALPASLNDLWQRLECEGDYPGFAWFSSYEDYEAAYIAVFDVGMPEPPVPLFESAHDKTHPAQEIALENTFFYDVLGLRSDPSQAVPDYLITQLQFLSALRHTPDNTAHG